MAEFAYNTAKSETTGMSPFEANYGMLLKQSWEPLNKTPYVNPASTTLENVWKCTWKRLWENILKAQIRTAKWFNSKSGKQADFKIGDLVMVDKKNMPTRRTSKKLDHKKAGPFQMIKVVGNEHIDYSYLKQVAHTQHTMYKCWSVTEEVQNLLGN